VYNREVLQNVSVMKFQIQAPREALYVSDFLEEIPKGIIDKAATGVGMSSIALEDKHPTVIAVPTIEVIKNKTAQYPNSRRSESVFGYYAAVRERSLKEYLDSTTVPKILVTYDSFYKVANLVNSKKYRIVVDEFSDLLDAYSYRDKAIESLLKAVQQFDYVSYISATPLKEEYYPEALKGLDEYEISWEGTIKIKVERKKTNKPYKLCCNIIDSYRAGGEEGLLMPNGHYSKAAYFFVNSVNSIASILEAKELDPSEVRVICANNEVNQKKLENYPIETALAPEKKFNFITSSAFKGCDFYSETGVIYIISNTSNSNTLISIDTDVKQIAGRIRNASNPFNNHIYHIYNTDNSLLSAEDFEKLVKKKTKATESTISLFYKGDKEERETYLSNYYLKAKCRFRDDDYTYLTEDQEIIFNHYAVLNDKRRWEVSSNVYRDGVSIREAYIKSGCFDISTYQDFEKLEDDGFLNKLTNGSFKEYCLRYINNPEERQYLADRFPVIYEAYRDLGEARMKALSYNPARFLSEMQINSRTTKNYITKELVSVLNVGGKYVASDIKNLLNNTYKKIGISKKAKATDIDTYFETEKKQKRINGTLKNIVEIKAVK